MDIVRLIGFELDTDNDTRSVGEIVEFDRSLPRDVWYGVYRGYRTKCTSPRYFVIEDPSEPYREASPSKIARQRYDELKCLEKRVEEQRAYFYEAIAR